MKNSGFTLVEFAVVLLVIGFIVAGVVAGSTLIKQAELRTIIAELEVYKNAYSTFKARYKMPPGDLTNADTLWAGNCAITISCNGNGNYAIDAVFGSATNETGKAWKHLDRAQLLQYPITAIPASYTGILNFDIAPKSKVGNIGYYMAAGGDIGGDLAAIASPFNSINAITNGLFLGSASASGGFTVGSITGKQAYDIDKKVDDGKINAAGVAIGNSSGLIQVIEDQAATSTCITAGSYNLTSANTTCILGYRLD